MIQRNGHGSEGDAYRYTRKVLLDGASPDVKERFIELVGLSGKSWTRAFYEAIRTVFFKDKDADIRFAPGVARMASSEVILFGTDWEEGLKILSLREIVKMISVNHRDEYDRYLNNLSFNELEKRYGTIVDECWDETKKKLNRLKYGPRRYIITELVDFNTAKEFYRYTVPHGWCHLAHESTLDSYRRNNTVRLYIACLPGFETMKEDDPLYGESMLGIDIGKDGRLVHVNNRWNHDHDHIDKRKGDNKYSAEELSMLMGAPFYRLCKPYSKQYYRNIATRVARENRKRMAAYEASLVKAKKVIVRGKHNIAGPIRKFVDLRDGNEYRTRRIGKTTWMLDPLQYRIPDASYDKPETHDFTGVLGFRNIRRGVNLSMADTADFAAYEEDWGNSIVEAPCIEYAATFTDGTQVTSRSHNDLCAEVCEALDGHGYIYRRRVVEKAIPEGWRLPTFDELMELLGYLGVEDDLYEQLCPKPALLKADYGDLGPLHAGNWVVHATSIYYNTEPIRIDKVKLEETGFDDSIFIDRFPEASCKVTDIRMNSTDSSSVKTPWVIHNMEDTQVGMTATQDAVADIRQINPAREDILEMRPETPDDVAEAINENTAEPPPVIPPHETGRSVANAVHRATEFLHGTGPNTTISVDRTIHYITAANDDGTSCTVSTVDIHEQLYKFVVGSGFYVDGRKISGDYRKSECGDELTTVKINRDGSFNIGHTQQRDATLYYINATSNINAGRIFLVKNMRRN